MSRVNAVKEDGVREPDFLDDVPNIRGKQGAVDWYRDKLHISVSYNNVKYATDTRELPSTLIGGAVHFSSLDLWRYITRNRRAQS